VTVLIAAAFIMVNLLVDLLYMVLNPRLRTVAPA
jgi:ABC-type dipeptide/oligopeptide/nickel transport system permease component